MSECAKCLDYRKLWAVKEFGFDAMEPGEAIVIRRTLDGHTVQRVSPATPEPSAVFPPGNHERPD